MTSLALYAAFPRQHYVAVTGLSLEKWYSNTLIAQLNSRKKRIDQEEVSQAVTFEITSIEPANAVWQGSVKRQEQASDQTSV